MPNALIMEVGGQWVVVVEGEGRRQEYCCESLEQARRWINLLRVPVRGDKKVLLKRRPGA